MMELLTEEGKKVKRGVFRHYEIWEKNREEYLNEKK